MFVFPTIDMLKTGQNILRLRKQAGLSVKNLQDIFGFSTPQAIYKWQHGTALPTIDNLVVLAAVRAKPGCRSAHKSGSFLPLSSKSAIRLIFMFGEK